jgi:hypothetical protein
VESLQTFLSVIGSPYLDALLLMRSTRSSGAFAADHSAVDWVLAVALNVADLSVLEVNVKAASAGTHLPGGAANLVGNNGRGIHAVTLLRRTRIGERRWVGAELAADRLVMLLRDSARHYASE